MMAAFSYCAVGHASTYALVTNGDNIKTALSAESVTAAGNVDSADEVNPNGNARIVSNLFGFGLQSGPSGLSLSVDEPGTNSAGSNGEVWNSADTSNAGVVVDLGSNVNIGALGIWGHVESSFFDSSWTVHVYADGDPDVNAGTLLLTSPVGSTTPAASVTIGAPAVTTGIVTGLANTENLGDVYLFDGSSGAPAEMTNATLHNHLSSSLSGRYLFITDIGGTTNFGGRSGFGELRVYALTAPEPGSLSLFALALVGTMMTRIRTRKRA